MVHVNNSECVITTFLLLQCETYHLQLERLLFQVEGEVNAILESGLSYFCSYLSERENELS